MSDTYKWEKPVYNRENGKAVLNISDWERIRQNQQYIRILARALTGNDIALNNVMQADAYAIPTDKAVNSLFQNIGILKSGLNFADGETAGYREPDCDYKSREKSPDYGAFNIAEQDLAILKELAAYKLFPFSLCGDTFCPQQPNGGLVCSDDLIELL